MKRLLVPILIGISAASIAQVTPFNINVGYGWSNTFDLKTGGSGRLQGIELGASQSIVKLPVLGEARVGGSLLLAGTMGGGGVKGTGYRVYAWYKTPYAGPKGVYGLGGLSYSGANGSDFDSVSGIGFDFGLGIPLSSSLPGVPSPSLELMYHQGSHAQTRGFSVSVSVKF